MYIPCARSISFEDVTGQDDQYSSSDIEKSIMNTAAWSIRPNSNNMEMIGLAAKLSAISMGDVQADAMLQHAQFVEDVQRVLLAEGADPIKAIIIPLASAKSVSNLFTNTPDNPVYTAVFVSFLNDIYMEVRGLKKQVCDRVDLTDISRSTWHVQLGLVEQQWPKVDRQLFSDWDHRLRTFSVEMQMIDTENKIIERSTEYLSMFATKNWDADVLSATSFLEVTTAGLRQQFEEAIMVPYWTQMELTTQAPTTHDRFQLVDTSSSAPLSWTDADAYCQTHFGKHLASIHSDKETEQALAVCSKGAPTKLSDFVGCWIGYRSVNGQPWYAADGSPVSYENWREGAPNNYKDGHSSDNGAFLKVNVENVPGNWDGSWEDTQTKANSRISRFLCNGATQGCSDTPMSGCMYTTEWDPYCCGGTTMSSMSRASCEGCTQQDCTPGECGSAKSARTPMLNVLDSAAAPGQFVLEGSYVLSHWLAGLVVLLVALLAVNLCHLARKKKYVVVQYDDSEDCADNEAKPMNV